MPDTNRAMTEAEWLQAKRNIDEETLCIFVKENQFTGIHLNWDLIECPAQRIPVPSGFYFRVGDVFTVANDLGENRFAPSSKHGYIEVVEARTRRCPTCGVPNGPDDSCDCYDTRGE